MELTDCPRTEERHQLSKVENAVSRTDAYPMPRIDDLIDLLFQPWIWPRASSSSPDAGSPMGSFYGLSGGGSKFLCGFSE